MDKRNGMETIYMYIYICMDDDESAGCSIFQRAKHTRNHGQKGNKRYLVSELWCTGVTYGDGVSDQAKGSLNYYHWKTHGLIANNELWAASYCYHYGYGVAIGDHIKYDSTVYYSVFLGPSADDRFLNTNWKVLQSERQETMLWSGIDNRTKGRKPELPNRN